MPDGKIVWSLQRCAEEAADVSKAVDYGDRYRAEHYGSGPCPERKLHGILVARQGNCPEAPVDV